MASKRLQVMGVIPVNEEDYGKSAYELAVDHGFEGSEEEWLESLKGKDGVDGVDGYTPVKGKDYFTQSDKDEVAIEAASRLTPLQINTWEEDD